MNKELIFGLFGGLGLFIYGIHLMGDGLQRVAGDRFRNILKALTSNVFKGVLVGAGITALIQSSSATTVMVVGFVNAGLMTLTQSLGVIFGANVGTTITAQIIAFKLTDYALPIIGVGMVLNIFSKKRFWKFLGLFLLGFGILFLGLNIMTSVVKPFANDPAVINAFVSINNRVLYGVLIGAAITALVQSSSVTVGIILGLVSIGLISIEGAIPIILGANIGTCATVMIASIGTSISARRAAIAHLLYNIIGAALFLIILKPFTLFITHTSSDAVRQCANAHTIMKIIETCIYLPFVGLFAKVVKKIVPGKELIIEAGPKYLEKHLISTPIFALDAATKELVRMADQAKEMVNEAATGFLDLNEKILKNLPKREEALDSLQEAVTNYLVLLTQRDLSEEESRRIPALLHSVNDIERIGDHSENLMELAIRRIDGNLPLTKSAVIEIKAMHDKIDAMSDSAIKALNTNSTEEAEKVLEIEKDVNFLTEKFRQNHIDRLGKGECNVRSGILFLDMISNFEKIGDHLTNVAQAVIGRLQWNAKKPTT
ncbi:MAG: Na/Pi cotransporter family protein [Candidatus Omnitrophica bacterium]|nr:Na/Pi cotransporter family protein [Candidatus Omnitrophota bacterium]